MYNKITGVALRTVRYSDRASILSVWTAQQGRISMLINASAGKESRRRRALTMPMSLIECEIDQRPGRDIANVREIRAFRACPEISANPIKAAVAMFMADVLTATVRDGGGGDPSLWAFIVDAVTALDKARHPRAIANFPAWYVAHTGIMQGVEPDLSTYTRDSYLDMTEGVFKPARPVRGVWLEPDRARLVPLLLTIPADALHRLPLESGHRAEMLTELLRYMALHNMPLDNLKSLPVLHALFR